MQGPSVDPTLKQYITVEKGAVIGEQTFVVTHGPIRPYMEDPSIVFGEHCYVGARCIVLLGIKIGRCSIVGAGSVVTRDVASYSISAGNPCKFIRWHTGYEILRQLVNKKMKLTQGLAKIHKSKPDGSPCGKPIDWSLLTLEDVKDVFELPKGVLEEGDPGLPLYWHLVQKQSAMPPNYDLMTIEDIHEVYFPIK